MAVALIGDGDASGFSQWGLTALMIAARNDHAECMRLLIDAGANKDALDEVRLCSCFALASSSYAALLFPLLFHQLQSAIFPSSLL